MMLTVASDWKGEPNWPWTGDFLATLALSEFGLAITPVVVTNQVVWFPCLKNCKVMSLRQSGETPNWFLMSGWHDAVQPVPIV